MSDEYSEDIKKLNEEIKSTKKEVEEEKKQSKKEYIQQQLLKKFDVYTLCIEFYDEQPFYYDKNKIFWMWNKEQYIWFMVDETDIINAVNETFELVGIATSQLQTQIINAIKLIGRKKTPELNNPNLVQFGKEIYDLKNNRHFPATPEYFITNRVPYTPSVSDECQNLDRLFDEWVGRNNRDLLYEIIAYCCYRDYPIHHIFCMVGSGSNGKSKFLKIIETFVGIDNCCSTSLDSLMISRFESANLYKKLVCTMGETNFSTMSRTEMLKRLTGQDLVSFEFKNRTAFSDYSYAKLIISTNTLPETTDRTDGFYRRWVIIDFPNKFNGEFDILQTIPEIEYNNLARKVLNILPNLLSYMKFTNVGNLEDRKKKYDDKSNPLPKFIDENIVYDPNCFIYKWEFKDRFNTYLIQNNLRAQSDVEIGIKMKNLEFTDKQIVSDNGKTWRAWQGIKWKNTQDVVSECKEEKICTDKVVKDVFDSTKDNLLLIFLDKTEIEIDKLLKLGYSEEQLLNWKVEGLIYESRAGYLSLLR